MFSTIQDYIKRDGVMAKNNYVESNKIILVGWMDRVLVSKWVYFHMNFINSLNNI